MAKSRGDFTDVLIKKRLLSADQVEEAEGQAKKSGKRLQDVLVANDYASMKDIYAAMAENFKVEFIDLENYEPSKTVLELLPESTAREQNILPIAWDGAVLKLATADPSKVEQIDNLRFILGKEIQPVLADIEHIRLAINKGYGNPNDGELESMGSMLSEFTDTHIEFTETEQTAAGQNDFESESPVVKLCNLIIAEAVNQRASDIHIEPFDDRVRIRYRIDGVLVKRDDVPKRLQPNLLSRLKIMASIDISEKRRPQDGRIKMSIQGKHFDLRVSVLPTVHGQSIVMRILDRSNIQVSIKDLGFFEEDYNRFQQIIKRPNGIFLVTGPTGSGKTTTLYAALNEMNRPDRKIITAEDPVEYYLPGINQTEVKHAIGLDFARIIRAMLRQAPNIILVGEIRDKETAEIAVQASLTGHLVFSTLHTNDAPSAITRMIDIGVPPFLVASSVIAIMAQRLVRVNCPKCKAPYRPTEKEIDAMSLTAEQVSAATFMRGKGCSNCNKTGYRGRRGIFEMMRMTSAIREMTFDRAPAQEIRRVAKKNGMRNLLADGIYKVCKGLTTSEELLSTVHADEVVH